MELIEIGPARLAAAYVMALVPLSLMLWYGVPLFRRTLVALVRMAVQLLFVGLYLSVVFELNRPWLTLAWLAAMILVADLSVLRGSGLNLRRMGWTLFAALAAGTLAPLLYFTGIVLGLPAVLEPQYAIPLGGMVLGNCLRADIVGLSRFFHAIRDQEKPFLLALSQGATLGEALRPYLQTAFRAALEPTVATIATIGLVSLPGMMTGVILAGADPLSAIQYQMVIMLAILSGTALTLWLALWLARRTAFTPWGTLDGRVLAGDRA